MCSPANSRSLLKTSPYHSRLFSYVGAHRCVRPTIAWLSSGQTHRSAPTAKLQTSCAKHFAFARREKEAYLQILGGLLKTFRCYYRLFSYVGAHRCVRPTIAWLSSGQTHRSAPTAKLQTSCARTYATHPSI